MAEEHHRYHVVDLSASTLLLQPPSPHQLMPIQLTGTNYLLWKSLFIPILKAYDMLNLAEGREQCPPRFLTSCEGKKECSSENPAYTSWIKRDQMFLTWINASLSRSLLQHTRDCTSGQSLWLHLENHFAKYAESHVLRLKARLENLDFYRHISMESYLRNVKEIADGLEEAGSFISGRELNSHIFKGLPQGYDELVASIREPPLGLQALHDVLIRSRVPRYPKPWAAFIICVVIFACIFSLVLWVILRPKNAKR